MDESGSFCSAGRTKAKPGPSASKMVWLNSIQVRVRLTRLQTISLGSNRDGPGSSSWSRSIWSSCFVSSARIISVTATFVWIVDFAGFRMMRWIVNGASKRLQIVKKKNKKKRKTK
jgi:hypothetical protein